MATRFSFGRRGRREFRPAWSSVRPPPRARPSAGEPAGGRSGAGMPKAGWRGVSCCERPSNTPRWISKVNATKEARWVLGLYFGSPSKRTKPMPHTHLTKAERYCIQEFLVMGWPLAAIAAVLERDRTMI